MKERTASVVTVVTIVVIVALSAYGYQGWSTSAVQALHDKYDYVIEAHVNVGSATGSLGPLPTNTSNLWEVNVTSADFGSVDAGGSSIKRGVKITKTTNLGDDTRLHVSTDLSVPGVQLVAAESAQTFAYTQVIVNPLKGYTWQVPAPVGFSKQPIFFVKVAPGTPAQEITFHILVQYSFAND